MISIKSIAICASTLFASGAIYWTLGKYLKSKTDPREDWSSSTNQKNEFKPCNEDKTNYSPVSKDQIQTEEAAIDAQKDAEKRARTLVEEVKTTEENVKEVKKEENTTKALAARNHAVKMAKNGRQERAEYLFQQALFLAPGHPDILNDYGEYLEGAKNDFMLANSCYLKALKINPRHPKAVKNYENTKARVEKLDECLFHQIANKKDKILIVPDELTIELSKKMREVSIENEIKYIYNTASIEGNTLNLAQTRMVLEGQDVSDKNVLEVKEIIGLQTAVNYLRSSLLKKQEQISEAVILKLHDHVLGLVNPNESGAYRRVQVYVGGRKCPSYQEVHNRMQEFIKWLNSDEARRLHPLKYAALAHFKLVFIHPFVDGNGRVSRLLMNFLLMKAKYPLVIIQKEKKDEYFQAIRDGVLGDINPFVRFIAQEIDKTLDVFLLAKSDLA
ncbi:protein adenylyltransferase Fic-like [Artemia franciscana]|uniref:Protein adenylyltransferase Fic n=1 Tax=Artemia franciscana TaxID=6661 RepID=A0AA88IAX6_ARTSF|nr:hypothetical protein QYM36_002211 [Artemia franciscana]